MDKEPVSKLCDELGLQPTVFYRRQKEFFENTAAFQTNNRGSRRPEQERIEQLEKKIQTKDEVLAELMAEHMALKKPWGTLTTTWTPPDVRDQIVDFLRRWSEKTDLHAGRSWATRGRYAGGSRAGPGRDSAPAVCPRRSGRSRTG